MTERRILKKGFFTIAALLLGSGIAAAEPPFKPVPAYSPEAQAVREAAALRQEGNRLQEQSLDEKAREAWQAAAEAYHRVGYQLGEGETFFQIAVSYQAEMTSNSEAMPRMLDAMARGANAMVEFMEGVAREAGPGMSPSNPEADTLLSQAMVFSQAGDCVHALPLFEAAGQRFAAAGSGIGELHALKGRLWCQQPKAGDAMGTMGFLRTVQDFMTIAKELQDKLKAGPALRFLRAAESAELGKLKEAEALLRSVLHMLEAAGDAAGAGRAALDLGCVLIQAGRPIEAEGFLKRARDTFASRKDPESRHNEAAARTNLAGVRSSGPQPRVERLQPAPVPPVPEPPWVPPLPEPAGLSPRARARREAAFLLGEGDRLNQAGRIAVARERWQAAADAYQRAEEPWELSRVYLRLGDSLAARPMTDESKRWLFLDYYDQGLTALAAAYQSSVSKELPLSAEALARAEDLWQQATRLSESDGCAQALPLLAEARRLYQQAGLALGEIRSLITQARCLARLRDYAGAAKAALEALPIAHALPMGSPASELKIHADDLFCQGRWQEARQAYQDLLCRSQRDRDVPKIALAMLGLGRVQDALGNPSEAEVALESSLGLLPLVDEEFDEKREATALEELGSIYFGTGRLKEGVAKMRQAQQIFVRAGQPEREVSCLRHLSLGLSENGEWAAALSALDEAAALQRYLSRNPEEEADLAIVRSFIEFHQGKIQAALAGLFKAQDLYGQKGTVQKQAAVLLLLANIQDFMGRHEEAVSLFQKAGNAGGGSTDAILPQLVRLEQLAVLFQHEKFQEAIELGQALLPSVGGSEEHIGEILVRGLLALSYLSLGKKTEARAELDVISRAVPKDSRDRSPSGLADETLAGALAQSFEKIYTFQEAASQLSEAGTAADDPRGSTLLAEFAKGLGKEVKSFESLAPSLGPHIELSVQGLRFLERYASRDTSGALRQVDEALTLVDRWASSLTVGELKVPFLSQFSSFYSQAVELSFAAGRPEEAFRHAEEARARAFADLIGNQKIDAVRGADPKLLREERQIRLRLSSVNRDLKTETTKALGDQSSERLENLQQSQQQAERDLKELGLRLKATNPEYASLLSVDTLSLEAVQKQVLDEETSLVEYFVPGSDGDGVIAWVIHHDRATMVQLPITSGDLKNRVRELRNLIESQQPVRSEATALYRDLFAPLVQHVRHSNLVIVPHSVLHFLPFAALWDEANRRFLGDAYALSYAPSATVLKFARAKKARAVGPVLVAGNPDGSLPRAAEEARAVARLYGGEPLLGRAATKSAVVAGAGQAGILHLAAHADLNQVNPLFTRIKLAPDGEHDGNLEMHEVFGLDLSKTGLVVLSACNTQMGTLSAGDELEGLTRAFLYAGTPAVVSSLWEVSDESTSFFMENFYRHLQKGAGRAESLRLAQMETRKRFPHPYQWAAFVLTGDGR